MNARDLMTPNPVSVRPTDTIGDAAAVLASYDIGVVPVINDDKGERLVGMLTDRDVVVRCTARHHDAMQCTVADHMTTADLTTVLPDTGLAELLDRMERAQIRRIPVVDNEFRLLGIVGQADLARAVGPENPALVEEMLLRVSTPTQSPGW